MCILQFTALDRSVFYLSTLLGYVTLCLNPIIYASRYEVFRRQLKRMMRKIAVTPANIAGVTNTAQPSPTQQ